MGRGRARTGPSDASGRSLELSEASRDGASGPLALQRSGARDFGRLATLLCTGLPRDASIRAFGPLYQPTPPLPRSVRRAYPRLLQQGSLH